MTSRPPCAETTDQLESALRSGDLTFEELQEVVLHIAVYLGWIVARRLDHLLVSAAASTGTAAGGSGSRAGTDTGTDVR
jgi:4-carboxymuconolactone decarboxylase